MDRAIDERKHPYYEMGWREGFTEGASKTHELLKKHIESCISKPFQIVVSGADPEKIKELLSAEPLFVTAIPEPSIERIDGWIPVSERMPDYGSEYLVANGPVVKTAYLDGAKDWVDDAGIILNYVTHWMPLPALPEANHADTKAD